MARRTQQKVVTEGVMASVGAERHNHSAVLNLFVVSTVLVLFVACGNRQWGVNAVDAGNWTTGQMKSITSSKSGIADRSSDGATTSNGTVFGRTHRMQPPEALPRFQRLGGPILKPGPQLTSPITSDATTTPSTSRTNPGKITSASTTTTTEISTARFQRKTPLTMPTKDTSSTLMPFTDTSSTVVPSTDTSSTVMPITNTSSTVMPTADIAATAFTTGETSSAFQTGAAIVSTSLISASTVSSAATQGGQTVDETTTYRTDTAGTSTTPFTTVT